MPVPRKLTANFVATEVDHELLIVDLDGGLLFSLEGSAREVWHAIDGVASEAEIASRMASAHEGDSAAIAADVHELLGELADVALIGFG